jgi:hypothetical protein
VWGSSYLLFLFCLMRLVFFFIRVYTQSWELILRLRIFGTLFVVKILYDLICKHFCCRGFFSNRRICSWLQIWIINSGMNLLRALNFWVQDRIYSNTIYDAIWVMKAFTFSNHNRVIDISDEWSLISACILMIILWLKRKLEWSIIWTGHIKNIFLWA